MVPPHGLCTFRINLNQFLRSDSHGWYCLSIHELSSMCANVDQMCDRMCTKVMTTGNADMLLLCKSSTEQQTTEIDTICGYHSGAMHGPHPLCTYYIVSLCQWYYWEDLIMSHSWQRNPYRYYNREYYAQLSWGHNSG